MRLCSAAHFLDSAEGKMLEREGKAMQVGTGTGGDVPGTVIHVATLELGSHTFQGLTVALTSHVGAFSLGFADGSLGVPLWQKGVISLDYAKRQLCFGVERAE